MSGKKWWFFCKKDEFCKNYEKYYNENKVPIPESKDWKDNRISNLDNLKQGDKIVVYSASNSTKDVRVFGIAEWKDRTTIDDCYEVKWEQIFGTEQTFLENNRGLHGNFREIDDADYNVILNTKSENDNDVLQGTRVEILFSKNIIFYGPPGTGKTREAKIRAAGITGIENVDEEIERNDGRSRIKLVQFHPSYSYFDFVEGIEARENGFELRDKVFKEFANRAANGAANSVEETTDNANETENNNYVLIIDEINRANMASVFGELLYALEYRGKSIDTSGGQLVVPDNLYIIGTMNTADVSIAGIDYAVRRRFDFIKMNSRMPDGVFYIDGENKPYEIRGNSLICDNDKYDFATAWIYDEQDNLSSYQVGDKMFISNLYNRVRIDVQNSVARGVNVEDIMPGISYFLVNKKKENDNDNDLVDKDHLYYKIDYEIAPLLLEYAKNGLFSKRYKIDGDKSLYDMLKNMEYSERLKKWIEEKG